MKTTLCLVAAAASLALAAPVHAQQASGRVKVVSGAAFIVRPAGPVPAEVGQLVFTSDTLRTGADGRLGITLDDDTRLSLGPASEVQLAAFQYAPAEGALALALRFLRGVAVYVSGQIARLSPDAVRLETPSAIVGVRGTTVAVSVVPR